MQIAYFFAEAPDADLSASDMTVVISIAALAVSLLAFLWTVGWTLWLDRRSTRAHVTVSTTLGYSDKTGAATVLNILVTKGPHRATTIRRVSIEPKGRAAFDVPISDLAVPTHSDTRLGPYDDWRGSTTLEMLWRRAPDQAPATRFRVAVHHDGRCDHSAKVKLA